MADACELCGKEVMTKKYRLKDTFGKFTDLGRIMVTILDEQLASEGIGWMCYKCQTFLLHLQKLNRDFTSLKDTLKALICSHKKNSINGK